MKPRREATPIVMEPDHVRVRRDPFGVTLVIGAWNEPFMLTLGPLVSGISVAHRRKRLTATAPEEAPGAVLAAAGRSRRGLSRARPPGSARASAA
jgi:acyl-CoA reductase-like NAD-dependent aldehyde dehydrogenase